MWSKRINLPQFWHKFGPFSLVPRENIPLVNIYNKCHDVIPHKSCLSATQQSCSLLTTTFRLLTVTCNSLEANLAWIRTPSIWKSLGGPHLLPLKRTWTEFEFLWDALGLLPLGHLGLPRDTFAFSLKSEINSEQMAKKWRACAQNQPAQDPSRICSIWTIPPKRRKGHNPEVFLTRAGACDYVFE